MNDRGGPSHGRDAGAGTRGAAWSRRLEQLDQELAAVGAGGGDGPPGRDGGTVDAVDVVDDTPGSPAGNGHQPVAVAGDPSADRGGERGDGDEADGDEDDDQNAATKRRRAFVDWVVVIGVALFVAFLVRTFVLAHFVVDGVSMSSTLQDEDRVFVNKLSYRLHDPNRGDVVVLHQLNGTSERDLIKRVIGLPGESVQFQDCQVIIDGRALEEPYLDPEALMPGSCGSDMAPLTIPDEHVFVMGDNRGGSMDSRAAEVGPVAEDDLVGRAFVVFWPSSNWQWL